jgi:hypothetical protein
MRYTELKDTQPAIFKRLTGVTPSTFTAMIQVIEDYQVSNRKHKNRGRPANLCVADKLLMLLMYYREYRTFLHISKAYGISEMHCWRTITSLEKILLQSPRFHLPGKKALHSSENMFEVIIVDVSEHPIERPKKNSENIIQAKRNDIP